MTILHSIDKPYMRLHNPILSCGNEYIGGLKTMCFPILQPYCLHYWGWQQGPTVSGKQIHDANIVATMIAYRIEYLLTHNVVDFERFTSLIHILPLDQEAA
jgi:hypothetical protein